MGSEKFHDLRRSSSVLCAPAGAGRAPAVKIADITRISGQRSNVLTGLGLVYGLKGTGDGGDFLPAIKPLAAMLSKFADPTTVQELANVAERGAGVDHGDRAGGRGARRASSSTAT